MNSLASENQNIKEKVSQVESENAEMKDRMRKLEGLLLEMGKAVSEMRKGN